MRDVCGAASPAGRVAQNPAFGSLSITTITVSGRLRSWTDARLRARWFMSHHQPHSDSERPTPDKSSERTAPRDRNKSFYPLLLTIHLKRVGPHACAPPRRGFSTSFQGPKCLSPCPQFAVVARSKGRPGLGLCAQQVGSAIFSGLTLETRRFAPSLRGGGNKPT